ncbi:MAG TPA: alpha/beta fold hydrolase [Methylomirabilota bacterium]|nr:alpha/beta fold hydrolase [Methylomirabilota bacterium]
MSERIGDLVLEHAAPAGRAHSRSVLFVHGMWGGSWYLRNYLYAAAQSGWDAWAVNLRGHGESPAPGGLERVSFLDYVDDVRRCLGELGDAVLVGHSMGGLIAQKAAEGGGVAAAVFMTSAPPRGIVSVEWPVLARAIRYVPAILTGRAFTVSRAHADALCLNRMSSEQREWAFPRFGPESGRATRELALGGIAVDAAAVRCPTLVVGAEDDRITPAALQRRIARRYGSEYQEAAGHGHMLMLEDGWEQPFKDVLAWMARAIDDR